MPPIHHNASKLRLNEFATPREQRTKAASYGQGNLARRVQVTHNMWAVIESTEDRAMVVYILRNLEYLSLRATLV